MERGIQAAVDSYNHLWLRCDCSWKRLCGTATLIGFVVSTHSPWLPMGNTGNNWWLKLTWVLRGHEISFNSSPDSLPPSPCSALSLEEYLHCAELLRLTYAIPSQSGEIAFKCCYWFHVHECDGKGVGGASEGLARMRGLQGCEMEDMAGKCEQWEAAIIQPSGMLSGCLVLPTDATTVQSLFSLLQADL